MHIDAAGGGGRPHDGGVVAGPECIGREPVDGRVGVDGAFEAAQHLAALRRRSASHDLAPVGHVDGIEAHGAVSHAADDERGRIGLGGRGRAELQDGVGRERRAAARGGQVGERGEGVEVAGRDQTDVAEVGSQA